MIGIGFLEKLLEMAQARELKNTIEGLLEPLRRFVNGVKTMAAGEAAEYITFFDVKKLLEAARQARGVIGDIPLCDGGDAGSSTAGATRHGDDASRGQGDGAVGTTRTSRPAPPIAQEKRMQSALAKIMAMRISGRVNGQSGYVLQRD